MHHWKVEGMDILKYALSVGPSKTGTLPSQSPGGCHSVRHTEK